MVSLSPVAGVPFFKQNKTEQCKQSFLSAAFPSLYHFLFHTDFLCASQTNPLYLNSFLRVSFSGDPNSDIFQSGSSHSPRHCPCVIISDLHGPRPRLFPEYHLTLSGQFLARLITSLYSEHFLHLGYGTLLPCGFT